MKKIILLPGNSFKNKTWADMWSKALSDQGFSVFVQNYHHWETGAEFADTVHEVDVLKSIADGTASDYIIVAKSIGSFIAMKAVVSGVVHPLQCVFFGCPLPWLEKNGYEPALVVSQYSNIRTVIFQNNQDPIAPFEIIHSAFVRNQNVSCIKLLGDTHNYFAEKSLVDEVCKIISL